MRSIWKVLKVAVLTLAGMAVAFVAFILWLIPSAPDGCGTEAAAWMHAQDEVRASMRAPASAEFPSILDARIARTGECAFTVQAHVDGQNGFGATVRQPFTVTIEHLPKSGRYITIELAM